MAFIHLSISLLVEPFLIVRLWRPKSYTTNKIRTTLSGSLPPPPENFISKDFAVFLYKFPVFIIDEFTLMPREEIVALVPGAIKLRQSKKTLTY